MFNTPVLKDMAALMTRRDLTQMESSIEPFSLLKMVNIDINAVRNSIHSIPTDEIEDIYPASPLQEGMVALTQHDSTQYMLQHVYDLQGEIDINAFRNAWSRLIENNAVFRTTFIFFENQCFQVVRKPTNTVFNEIYDARNE